jgi:uncharacterized phage protein gp47/JayE
MAFQVKDFVSITASMINWMKASTKKISDYNIGSVVRTMVEAVASEIDELYQQFFIGVKEAIPVAVYNSFSFDKLPAINAAGLIRVELTPSDDLSVIQAGTTFAAAGLASTYTSLQDTTVPAGASFIDITVRADVTGTAGNVAAGQNFTLTPSPPAFVSASNLNAFSSGQDIETDEERKLRFAAYIDSISRATNSALRYGLRTATLTDADGNIIERVSAAVTIEPYLTNPLQPIALVECYIHNGIGGTSIALVARAQQIIEGYYQDNGVAVPGYKASGIKTPVYAAEEVIQAVVGTLIADDGYDQPTLAAEAERVVFAYLQGLDIGQPAVMAEIIYLVKDIEGVYDFVPTTPSSNVTVTAKQKLMPGSISIT